MKLKGIDVSTYNEIADYNKAAADGVEFGIIKIIRKDLKPDKRFEQHWSGFEAAGIPIQGVYNYSYATTPAKFQADARRVLEVLAGRKTMVWLDIEDKSLAGLGKTLVEGIRAYAETIQGAGLKFGIYTYLAFYNANLVPYKARLEYPYWVARYPSSAAVDIDKAPDTAKCPDIRQQLYGWQYSSKGVVDGIKGHVDLNEWYVDIEAAGNAPQQSTGDYTRDGFRVDLARSLGLSEGSSPEDVLKHTVTVSSKINRYHASVTALERLLKEYGYYTGTIEADRGQRPNFGAGMTKATKLYQSQIMGYKRPDAEWSSGNKSYKKALHMM